MHVLAYVLIALEIAQREPQRLNVGVGGVHHTRDSRGHDGREACISNTRVSAVRTAFIAAGVLCFVPIPQPMSSTVFPSKRSYRAPANALVSEHTDGTQVTLSC